jgi:hypothetical protein
MTAPLEAIFQHLGITYDASKTQYRCSSPLRAGSDSNSFSIKVDERGGTYYDHVTNESGTLTQLADRLGITYTRSTTSKRSYMSGAEYAAQHGVAWSVPSRQAGVRLNTCAGAADYGDSARPWRYRFLDYRK